MIEYSLAFTIAFVWYALALHRLWYLFTNSRYYRTVQRVSEPLQEYRYKGDLIAYHFHNGYGAIVSHYFDYTLTPLDKQRRPVYSDTITHLTWEECQELIIGLRSL